ncbi:MAG: SPFH domain-containing protein [Phycisphaeraceae bacterium]|nr:SPFH domain-containing protein [Phycisphaeraceae bacterium]
MDFWKKLKGELIDIVEWLDDSRDTLVYRFERMNNEIKYGAKLIVRESQVAVFVDQGKIADVFQPGIYTLETKNLPILSTLLGWKYGFESPFKAEVYFVNTRQFTDCKWGTSNPIMLRDAEFGPMRLRAYGTYAFRVADAGALVKEVAGTAGRFTADGITDQLRNFIVTCFTDALAESKVPALDLASNYEELSSLIASKIRPPFKTYGIDVTAFLIENISLPPEVEAALDKRTSMGVIGDMGKFTQFQTATAIGDAAKNPSGGGMAQGMGIGAGFAMANQMAGAISGSNAAPPPIPGVAAPKYFVAIDGKQAGPFDMATLAQLGNSGKLTAQTLVWKHGMSAWAAASDVPELAPALGSNPPPLP